MKRRYGDLASHSMIIDKKTTYKKFEIDGEEWSVYLHKINKVTNEMIGKRPDGKEVVFLKDGFYWLILYPTKSKYALTVAFTEKKEFVEIYTDVIINSGISENGVAYIDDLFLDVVYTADEEVVLLDSAEFEEALNKKEITYKEYIHANMVSNELVEKYYNKNYMEKYLEKIKNIFEDMLKEVE